MRAAFVLSSTLLILSVGCGGTAAVDDGTGGATSTGSTTSSSSSSSSSGTTTSSNTTAAACGGLQGLTCEAGAYCDFEPNGCGGDDDMGICKPSPEGCDLNYQPVCGCDGQVHGNECGAYSAGVDINMWGSCTPPQAMFSCGPWFCDLPYSYCEVQISDVVGVGNTYSCKPLLKDCKPTPSCECLASEPCGFQCKGNATEGLTLTCPGG